MTLSDQDTVRNACVTALQGHFTFLSCWQKQNERVFAATLSPFPQSFSDPVMEAILLIHSYETHAISACRNALLV